MHLMHHVMLALRQQSQALRSPPLSPGKLGMESVVRLTGTSGKISRVAAT